MKNLKLHTAFKIPLLSEAIKEGWRSWGGLF